MTCSRLPLLLLLALWTVVGVGVGVSAAPRVVTTTAAPEVNSTELEVKPPPIRHKKKTSDRSTSSSSRERDNKNSKQAEADKESLDEKDSRSGSDTTNSKHIGQNIDDAPKSTVERHGWMKWHRKCNKCPEDQHMKWRDPRIKWVCGAYQRARRSFKSRCMMHYRNCQDGTMFVAIHEHRCANSTPDEHGEHFMYDYRVALSADSTDTGADDEDSESTSSESSSSAADE